LERYDYEKAALIQKAWRLWKGKKKALEQRAAAANLFKGKKERRRESVNRKFDGDYVRYDANFGLQSAIPRASTLSFTKTFQTRSVFANTRFFLKQRTNVSCLVTKL